MMRTRFAITTGALAIWAMGSVAAHSFEQTPAAPAPAAPVTVPAPQPDLSFDDKTRVTGPKKKGRSLKLPVVGKISVPKLPGVGKISVPKLNFGLDLMYGSSEPADTGLGFSADLPTDDDLTILGKFKRRF